MNELPGLFIGKDQIQCRDAFAWLGDFAPGSVDLFITEPPYASLEKHRDHGTTTRLVEQWFDTIPNESFGELFALMAAALKPDRHLYMFCDDETSDIAVAAGKRAGLTYWKRIVWDKGRLGMGYHYRNQHEFICFFEKGKRNLNGVGRLCSILPFRLRVQRGQQPYPTQKPTELIELLIGASSEPGELVADPFCGSGTVAVAAVKLGRDYFVCDNSPKAVELTDARLSRLVP